MKNQNGTPLQVVNSHSEEKASPIQQNERPDKHTVTKYIDKSIDHDEILWNR